MILDKSDPFYLLSIHKNQLSNIAIQQDEGGEPDQPGIHTHPYHEIIYCRNNCGAEFHVGTSKYLLQRGDVILIPPETPHSWLIRSRSAEPYMGYRFCLTSEYVATLRLLWPDLHFPGDEQYSIIRTMGTVWEPIGDMFRALYEEAHFKNAGWEAASTASCIYLLTQLNRAIINNPRSQVQKQHADLVEVVISYVKTHLGEKITLEGVAQRFWVSSSTITHLFNKRLGISFYKYVMGLRLAEAKNLITEGMPMEKIAIRVGFGDYSAFYRAFKKEFGISPRQYQQSTE